MSSGRRKRFPADLSVTLQSSVKEIPCKILIAGNVK
jgi:hypothetical protein